MPDRHAAGRPVDFRPVKIPCARLAFAGVQTHAHLEGSGIWGPVLSREGFLRGQDCGNPIPGRFENDVEAVAGRFNNAATVGHKRLLEQLVVPGRNALHQLGVLLPQRGAVFEIGEQEGKDARKGGFGHGHWTF